MSASVFLAETHEEDSYHGCLCAGPPSLSSTSHHQRSPTGRTPTMNPASAAESRWSGRRGKPATKPASAAESRWSGRRGQPARAAESRWSGRWRPAWPRVRSRARPSSRCAAVSPPLSAGGARRPGTPGRAQRGGRSAWVNAHLYLSRSRPQNAERRMLILIAKGRIQ